MANKNIEIGVKKAIAARNDFDPLVNSRIRCRLRPPQLLHRLEYLPPHRGPVQVARLKHGVRPHGGMGRRVGAVVLHEHLGGAEDVEVGDH